MGSIGRSLFFGTLLLSASALAGPGRLDASDLDQMITESQQVEKSMRQNYRDQAGLSQDPETAKTKADRTIAGSSEAVAVTSSAAIASTPEPAAPQAVQEPNYDHVVQELDELEGP